MTGLLVSVRDQVEAEAAIRGRADLIDVKEPARGSLGAADPSVWAEVARAVNGIRPISVALGELLDPETSTRTECVKQVASIRYAKVGLAGCLDCADWQNRWVDSNTRLPSSVEPVAVAYADWSNARSPAPQTVLSVAEQNQVRVLLLDTLDKHSGDLFDHMPLCDLTEFANQARECGMRFVVGGSLRLDTIRIAMNFNPDYIAVRGAVCVGSRTGCVDELLVRSSAQAIHRRSKVSNT